MLPNRRHLGASKRAICGSSKKFGCESCKTNGKKNKFHAFDVVIDDSQKRTVKTKSKSQLPLIAAIFGILVLGVGGYLFYQNTQNESISEKKQIVKDNLPVILVKPFKNLGSEDNSVSNALTESLISSLSRYKGITVMSSSMSFHVIETNDTSSRNEVLDNILVSQD